MVLFSAFLMILFISGDAIKDITLLYQIESLKRKQNHFYVHLPEAK